MSDMQASKNGFTVDELNRALHLGRLMFFGIFAIVFGGFALSIAFAIIGNQFNKPYGLYIGGQGLGTWGLVFTLVALIVYMYWIGFKIGKVLRDPVMFLIPGLGIMLMGQVVTQRAKELNMKPGFLMKPLRPIEK
jgi:hypothetical protein